MFYQNAYLRQQDTVILITYIWQPSASGDNGVPEVVADPLVEGSKTYKELGICVVQKCAKFCRQAILDLQYLFNFLSGKRSTSQLLSS